MWPLTNELQKMIRLLGYLTSPWGKPEIKEVTIETIYGFNKYVARKNNENQLIGVVDEVSKVEQAVKLNFLHSSVHHQISISKED